MNGHCPDLIRRSCSTIRGSFLAASATRLRARARCAIWSAPNGRPTSVTFKAEEELREFFEQHKLPPPRLVLRSQSALTLMVSLANSDLLTMVPVQWTKFPAIANMLAAIPVKETFQGAVDRRGPPRRTAVDAGGRISAGPPQAQRAAHLMRCADPRLNDRKREALLALDVAFADDLRPSLGLGFDEIRTRPAYLPLPSRSAAPSARPPAWR